MEKEASASFFYMNKFELFFLDFGLSWTIAKVLPYFLFLLIGIVISYYLFKKSSKKKKLFLGVSIAILPLIGYFILHPIYEGDFSNSPYLPDVKKVEELKKDALVVIAIPGCPYCIESINKLNILKSRNPKLQIRFLVCTTDSKDLKVYKNLLSKSIRVEKTKETEKLLAIANFGFPTFLTVRNGTIKKAWSNDNFGVRALDEIEKGF